jgi:hypothetical protein
MERTYDVSNTITNCSGADEFVNFSSAHSFVEGELVRNTSTECTSILQNTAYYICDAANGFTSLKFKLSTTYADAMDDCSDALNLDSDSTITGTLHGGNTLSGFNTAGTFIHSWSDSDYDTDVGTRVASSIHADFRTSDTNTGYHLIPNFSTIRSTAISSALSNGTITNFKGMEIEDIQGSGTTVTNNYGLYLRQRTYGTNDYQIFSDGGTVDFLVDANGVGIGSLTAAAAYLHLKGNGQAITVQRSDGTNILQVSTANESMTANAVTGIYYDGTVAFTVGTSSGAIKLNVDTTNGITTITDIMKITPRATKPSTCSVGSTYFNSGTSKAIDACNAPNGIEFLTNHGMASGAALIPSNNDCGLTAGTTYYACYIDSKDIYLTTSYTDAIGSCSNKVTVTSLGYGVPTSVLSGVSGMCLCTATNTWSAVPSVTTTNPKNAICN